MKTKLFALALCVGLICMSFAGCVSSEDENEIKAAAAELIEESYEINEIYFGKGLAATDEEVIAQAEYVYVSSENDYTTTEQIKEATAKVYSRDYCETYLFPLAFEGLFTENDETISYARYLEDTKGNLTIRKSVAEDGLELSRTYDLNSIRVESAVRDTATIKVQSYVDGEADEDVTLTLTREADGWRLNSPTY